MYRSSWCEVDLAQLRTNIRLIRKPLGTRKALLVVKANAYGHGIVPIAAEAEAAGIDMLGVATVGEAEWILDAGIETPMLIMCAMDPAEIEYAVAHGVNFMAWTTTHFDTARRAAEKYGVAPQIHLEIDTGMSRSGVDRDDVLQLLSDLSEPMRESIVGLMTHFHSADMPDLDSAKVQLAEFSRAVEVVHQYGIRPTVHVANSPGALRIPDSWMDMVRIGIAGYGLPPSEYTPLPDGVLPILNWVAQVTNTKSVPPGRGVGYAWRYIAETDVQVATLGVGYADGYRRAPLGVNVLRFKERDARVVGSVFMDQCLFLVPDGVGCSVGDTAVLVSSTPGSSQSAEAIAERWGTNNYDVVASIRNRVPRRYCGGISPRNDV